MVCIAKAHSDLEGAGIHFGAPILRKAYSFANYTFYFYDGFSFFFFISTFSLISLPQSTVLSHRKDTNSVIQSMSTFHNQEVWTESEACSSTDRSGNPGASRKRDRQHPTHMSVAVSTESTDYKLQRDV